MAKPRKSQRKKITCLGCDSTEIRCRGLCQKCYSNARYMIAKEETTEEQLAKQGLILPSKRESEFRRTVAKVS